MIDLDRLAYAISWAETSNCSKGTGVTRNNCFGIMRGGKFVRYKTKEESYKDFKQIWAKWYKIFPTRQMAVKWTGNDSVDDWLRIVKKYYYEN